MSRSTVLKEIDPLPGAQAELAGVDGDGQASWGEHGADVRWRIVRAFQDVALPGLVWGCQAIHKCFQVELSGGVVVLADHQGGAGVLDEQVAHAFLHAPLAQARGDFLGKGIETFTAGGNLQGVFEPAHELNKVQGASEKLQLIEAPHTCKLISSIY